MLSDRGRRGAAHARRQSGRFGQGGWLGLARPTMCIGLVSSLVVGSATSVDAAPDVVGTARTLDGSHNNLRHPTWGQADVDYRRNAGVRYADGRGQPAGGPALRYLSNRVFNDSHQNLSSENGLSQWSSAWAQFLDHTFGLRATAGGESQPLPFDAGDPQEEFRNDFGAVDFRRTPATPGTGTSTRNPRQQRNTIDSYIDASALYSNDPARLEWLREGPVDGNLANNSALLLLPGDDLPRADSRGNPATAPAMDREGRLRRTPDRAVVAGDVRANENIALQGIHLLFAREHNRIVRALPASLPQEEKFQIARRVVGATQQHITYREFLPALGVRLSPYRGYKPSVNATLSNEFATVGFRGHSMVHGIYNPIVNPADFTEAELAALRAQGVQITTLEDGRLNLIVPLNVAFFNPDLVPAIGLDPILQGLGNVLDYRNDEQIDNQLRSVLFQVPRPDAPDPNTCLDGPSLPNCFQGVTDLGAIDVARARDHGIPTYNELRQAYGLQPKTSFTAITGERTASFPSDPEVDPTNPLDDPDILDFVELRDKDGNILEPGTIEAEFLAVSGVRRTTLAARLNSIYGGRVGDVDAFVGMVSEPHVGGSEFGELQHRMWKEEFERLRDGDRFFYGNDPVLDQIRAEYGIDYRRTLSQVIVDNTALDPDDIPTDVFHFPF